MARSRLILGLIGANVLIPIAILIFATGFFPYKPFLPGLAQFHEVEQGEPPAAPFDRLVLMVVDALRSDFVYSEGSGFQFTQSLIRDGVAVPFTANARSPTITMPRIKAITTGSIPSFLDVILNFDETDTTSSLSSQDTWLAQMKAKGTGKLIMFGDDTWLKLFPETFDRHDGTSSFFVSDFTEVDNNVTRNIAAELQNQDWNTMVLHYLGLDHIGHKAGPRSPNMVPKQREMDGIVEQLYAAMRSHEHLSSTLLVLCGDHGMNDAGNHGASSPGETSPALVFVSPKLRPMAPQVHVPASFREDFRYYSFVEQSDLAPTLAALLGFPVPKNNVGAFIPDFLPLWSRRSDQVHILMQNAKQILGIATAAFGDGLFTVKPAAQVCSDLESDRCSQVERLACGWHRINEGLLAMGQEDELPTEWRERVFEWLRDAQDLISSMASNYNLGRLVLGVLLAASASLLALLALFSADIHEGTHLLPLAAIIIAYGLMMFASSYVEEEHHFWYWSTSAWMAIRFGEWSQRKSPTKQCLQWLAVMTATRLIRGWNRTGQKFAGEPDIVKTFVVTRPGLLWLLVLLTYSNVFRLAINSCLGHVPTATTRLLCASIVVLALWFKMWFTRELAPELMVGFVGRALDIAAILNTSLLAQARRVFAGVGALAGYAVMLALGGGRRARGASEYLHQLYTIVALTQTRAANIPLFFLLEVQFLALRFRRLSVPRISISLLLLQHMSFFAFGGTNAISSVDLSSAYNGVNGFNLGAVGVLTYLSNWAGPVYWTSATTLLLLQKRREGHGGAFGQHVAVLTVFSSCTVFFVMVACTMLRSHLFVWTVFSPKYLYCMAWNMGQHLIVNIGICGVLYWIGSKASEPRLIAI